MATVEYLENAINDVDTLIAITRQDLEDIKKAYNDAIFERMEKKDALIASFTQNMDSFRKQVATKLQEVHPNASITDLTQEEKSALVGEECTQYTAQLHDKLAELKKVNYHFGRISLGVSEFYNSLLEQIFPVQMNGYNKTLGSSSILKADA